jgi:hypothetical protein
VRGGNAEGEDPKLKEGSVLMRDRRGPMPWNGTGVRAALVAAVLVGVALVPRGVAAQTQASSPTAFDDGPHVFWANATNAFVFYICGGQFKMERYRVSGSLTFKGLCADSLVQRTVSARAPKAGPFEYDGVDRIFTVSDIHGEYDALVGILRKAGVVDDDLRWAWGKGHLVVLGDVFDRGGLVTECLWLIHRLEAEAEKAGGRVHYLLGNHEMMVLRGDLRYVNARYADGIVKMTRIAYPDLFGPDMELGRWLRTRPAAVRLNGVLFVHGGLGPAALERGLTLADLNATASQIIDLPYYIQSSEGPFWYRGYFGPSTSYPAITEAQLDSVLAFYEAKAVVVGHSEDTVATIKRLFGGRVYGVDVKLEELGGFEGLLWKGGTFLRVGVDGTAEPFKESPAPVSP